MSKSVSLVIVLALAPLGLQAQEALPLLPDILAEVQDTEVYLKGYLGFEHVEGVSFALPDTGHVAFPVTFESDEDLMARMKGCSWETGTPCQVAAYAYVQWDGPLLRLIVTSIETIAAPGKMSP